LNSHKDQKANNNFIHFLFLVFEGRLINFFLLQHANLLVNIQQDYNSQNGNPQI